MATPRLTNTRRFPTVSVLRCIGGAAVYCLPLGMGVTPREELSDQAGCLNGMLKAVVSLPIHLWQGDVQLCTNISPK